MAFADLPNTALIRFMTEIVITVHVTRKSANALNIGQDHLENVLVVQVENGK